MKPMNKKRRYRPCVECGENVDGMYMFCDGYWHPACRDKRVRREAIERKDAEWKKERKAETRVRGRGHGSRSPTPPPRPSGLVTRR